MRDYGPGGGVAAARPGSKMAAGYIIATNFAMCLARF